MKVQFFGSAFLKGEQPDDRCLRVMDSDWKLPANHYKDEPIQVDF